MEQIPKKKNQKTKPKQTTRQMQNKWHKHTPYWAYCLVENPSYEHRQCRGNLLAPQVSKGELPAADGKETVLEEEPWQVARSELLTGPSPDPVPGCAAWRATAVMFALCRAPWHFILRWLGWEGWDSCSLWRAETWAAGLAQELLHQLLQLQSNLSYTPAQ